MSETTTKKPIRKKQKLFNNEIKRQLCAKYKISPSMFYRCFDGSRSSEMSLIVRKEYNALNDAMTKALEEAKAQLSNK